MASRKPKSSELEGDELCCLSKANNLNAVTACTLCRSTAKSKGVLKRERKKNELTKKNYTYMYIYYHI